MPIPERTSVATSKPLASNSKVEEFERLQKDQDAGSSVDYRRSFLVKLSKKSLFFIVIPAIPVFLLFLCFLLLIDTRTIVHASPSTTPSTVVSTTPSRNPPTPRSIYRLPTDVIPSLYSLTLRVYLPYKKEVDFGERNQSIAGYVLISFYCRNGTDRIVLNQNELLVDNSSIKLADQDTRKRFFVFISKIDNKAKIMELAVSPPLEKGRNYSLYMKYSTIMRQPSEGGIFLASYKIGNETRYHAVSQMQPLDAKRVFPCFDDPGFKAVFQINVVHPSGTTALSNTEAFKKTSINEHWTQTEFEMTPIMSTYLLAIVVTDFDYIEDKYRNITLRIWATPDALPHCGYALGLLSKALNFYENYFNISYPLSKLDVYGVPELRVVGMENWGMITVQTPILTFDPSFSSSKDKSKTDMTIFHEIAHMWFGNLVTMKWWNDLWLNEGFACHMSRIAMENLSDPLIDVDQAFMSYIWSTISRDENRAAPILSPDIKSEDSIGGVFNVASYYKGEALIRMIKKATGDNFFQRTLQNFIKTHIHGNVISEHLADALTRALEVYDHNNPFDGMPVNQVMKHWTHKKGFPTIIVKTINSTTVSLHQASFYSAQRTFIDDFWIVPVFYKEDIYSKDQQIVWLKDNRSILLDNVAVIDPNFYGYYKVLYDKDTYRKLVDILLEDHELISRAGRSRMLYETFIFQRYGILTTEPLELMRYINKEVEEGPFVIACNFLELFYTIFPNDLNLKEYQFHLLVPVYERVKLDKSEREYGPVRQLLIQRLCSWGYQRCRDYVIEEFGLLVKECKNDLLSSSCNKITPDIRAGIYSMALKYGSPEYFDFLWEKYLLESNLLERDRIIQGLTGTVISNQIEKVVSYQIYNETKMTDQHAFWSFFLHTGNIEKLRPVLNNHIHGYIPHLVNTCCPSNRPQKTKTFKFLINMIMALYRMLPTSENLLLLDQYDKTIEPLLPSSHKGLLREARKNPVNDYQFLLKNKDVYERYFRDFAKRIK